MRCMILAATLLCSLSAVCQAGQIYKWVDAQGQTHFDAQPPANQPAQQIDIKQTQTPPSRAALPKAPLSGSDHGDQAAIDAKVKKQVAVQEAKRATYCENVRTNLAQLRNNPRARLEVNGVIRRLTDEERQTRTAEAEKGIADNCQ
ncbi:MULTISPECIES: DUF4124 domain-containing protein [unclassified Pseudomonas]|uniref:DUF4124 domain-containing protein n=1 Tax=unclassified Pseudomonas TaxID=196821 RepID=UPI002AC8F600|nr:MULTISPECIES: DUF4124 domain-containing protein [unclassified Pseudomonas]MEB0040741.1 DUF4124 domain-containing protein [Pseudomonas sp. MH10]MEB0078639.1 DUF4124 domain-containing protein [Pseudomonas sp. MH10out]MEB0091682.1 DUF4124 domain-containing protein [Pseudomonas sp. CCI4.2]MEB0099916.1 DUF4124 domain-containing protein [Pseudomonas sp. CCI3.2]MEB0123581.1 DUF4124 domain-containing protein [Pseudomonas sp. CCI1.2]